MKTIKVKKGQILQRKGEFNTKVFKVKNGLLRSYAIDHKGKEHIFMFAPENWIIADACQQDSPCELFIDALEDSEIEVNAKEENYNLVNFSAMVKRMKVLQSRIIGLMSSTAIERYEEFVKTYPAITQRVSQRMIASYLGITPEALSKAKGDQFRSK